ncbi:MAG: GatB/YqeY domain-containing protein [Deltaproteobacteria bacterium]
MELRARISDALKSAMKAHEAETVSVLRMVNSTIKNRDIEARGQGEDSPVSDTQVLALLGKMVKQRQESAKAFRDGDREAMAAKEEAEIRVIEGYLPQQMSAAEMDAAISAAIAETGATAMKDMGKVMAVLKERHTGAMDFGAAGPMVKAKLG